MTLYQDYFKETHGSTEMHSIFSFESKVNSWLRVESSLAKVQGSLGIIPIQASKEIMKAAKISNLDFELMHEDYLKIGFPIMPFVKQLSKASGEVGSLWVHWGATTQDIIDTGLVLQIRDAMNVIQDEFISILDALSLLIREHKNTVMAGRTFRQQAAPITFGFKSAIWMSELLRHYKSLKRIQKECLFCSYGGAVGNISTLDNKGYDVAIALSKDLGLINPSISWHTARDSFSEIIFWLASAGATFGKIATEISTLMSTEIGEVNEPYCSGKGSSSTMPQKRNPTLCPIIIANSIRLRDLVPSQLTAMIQDHERSTSGQSLEWLIIPDAFILFSGILESSKKLFQGLQVNQINMIENLNKSKGLLMAESVMMALAPAIGRMQAHDLVTEVVNDSMDTTISFKEALMSNKRILKILNKVEIEKALEPKNYIGSNDQSIRRVLNDFKKIITHAK